MEDKKEWFPLPSSDKESFESHTLKEDDIGDQISDTNDKKQSSDLLARNEKNESSKETELSEMLPVSYDASVMALRRNLISEHYDSDANKQMEERWFTPHVTDDAATNTKPSAKGKLENFRTLRATSCEEVNIAAMQRPEPLGKAKVEMDIKKIQNSKQRDINPSSGDGPTKIDVPEGPLLWNAGMIPVSTRPETVHFEKGNAPSNEGLDDSVEGLEEQQYPIRVPLSVSEGYNGFANQFRPQQGIGANELGEEKYGFDPNDRDLWSAELQKTDSNALISISDEIPQGPIESKSDAEANPERDRDSGNSYYKRLNSISESSDASVGSYRGIAGVKTDVGTPISTLLGPTYKSSVALLEELKKRRFKNNAEAIANEIASAVTDENAAIDPLQLAENAMKASVILSNRTEKSLKRASKVLEAVKEQRSPPGDSSPSFTMEGISKEDSISAKLRELSISSLSLDGPAFSANTSNEREEGKDSIDLMIENRLKAKNTISTASSLSTSSSASNYRSKFSKEEDTKPFSSKSSEWSSRSETSGLSSSTNAFDSVKSKRANSLGPKAVCFEDIQSSLDDATSSELLRLKSFVEAEESPKYDTQALKLKLLNPLKDISPIEKQNKGNPSKTVGLQSSSRMQKDNVTDSDIVRFHRSMGAGTVTPLPDTLSDLTAEQYQIRDVNSSSSLSSTSPLGVSIGRETIISDGDVKASKNGMTYPSRSTTVHSTREASAEKRPEITGETLSPCGKDSDSLSKIESLNSKDAQAIKADKYITTSYVPNESKEKSDVLGINEPEKAKLENALRGIYDIRDSSGPGSTNRKRRGVGKKPRQNKNVVRDPFTVYVSEQSKSSDGSLRLEAMEHLRQHANTEAANNSRSSQEKAPDSFSSMSSQSPYLSYSGSRSISDFSQMPVRPDDSASLSRYTSIQEELFQSENKYPKVGNEGNDNDYTIKSIYSNKKNLTEEFEPCPILIARDVPTAREQSFSSQNVVLQQRRADDDKLPVKVAWDRESNNQPIPKQPRDFNKLWQKFQERFSPQSFVGSNTPGRGSVLEKIDVLKELLSDQPITPQQFSIPKSKSKGERGESVSSKGNARKSATEIVTSCVNCNKRDIGTNFPTPALSECGVSDTDDDKPLLLHTWTQTTPSSILRIGGSVSHRGIASTHRNGTEDKTTAAAKMVHRPLQSSNKENSQNQANSTPARNTENNDKMASSWSVTFQEKQEKKRSRALSHKPPIPPISRVDLKSQGNLSKKRKDPVFTAWFQSTRSDTSSGTVVPLSEVPKLANAFKDNRNAAKIYIGEVDSKETGTLVRVGLQEAFKFAKEDFIRRSKERVEQVKNAKLHAEKRKNWKNLKERNLEEALIKDKQHSKHSPGIDHLFRPKKRQIDKKEMREQNKKRYEQLPEVVRKREENKRKTEYESNRVRLKQFDKKLRTRLLKSRKV